MKSKLTQAQLEQITEQSIGIVELPAEALGNVAGGAAGADSASFTCITNNPKDCRITYTGCDTYTSRC